MTNPARDHILSKVPAITLGLWLIKVLATAALAALIVALILILPQRAGSHSKS